MVGKPYAVAIRLYGVAAEHWPELDAAFAAVDLIQLPAHRFLNCVRAWCLDRIEPEKREEWLAMLEMPLPWRPDAEPSQETLEREGQDFMNFMASMGGMG